MLYVYCKENVPTIEANASQTIAAIVTAFLIKLL